MLKYKKVDYKIVIISRVEPRPTRRPLDGGYRRTPVLQINNHSYCDTKAAILELEKRFPEPSLFPKLNTAKESSEGLARGLSLWMDTHLFMNVVSQIPVMSDDVFLADRSAFAGRPMDRAAISAGAPLMRATIRAELNVALETIGTKPWVLDTETPSLVDFSLVMITFFALNMVGENMQRALGAVDWGRTESMPTITAEEAIEVLKCHQDAEIEADFKVHNSLLPIQLGQQVLITPLDTGKLPVGGVLVRSTVEETVISYKDPSYGTTTYIHFPSMGFVVVPNPSAK